MDLGTKLYNKTYLLTKAGRKHCRSKTLTKAGQKHWRSKTMTKAGQKHCRAKTLPLKPTLSKLLAKASQST